MREKKNTQRGFTLVELMVVVVIVAILAAIALPSYQQHVIRGRRAAAQQLMMDVAARQEQYLADRRSYASTLPALGITVPAEIDPYYTISLSLDTPPNPWWKITATPKAGSAQAGDATLQLYSDGTKTPGDKWK
jgi:type IV pilus assembly protein PilE